MLTKHQTLTGGPTGPRSPEKISVITLDPFRCQPAAVSPVALRSPKKNTRIKKLCPSHRRQPPSE